jgi:hypothetical protein
MATAERPPLNNTGPRSEGTAPCRYRLYCWRFEDPCCIHLQGEITTQWPLPILIVQDRGRRELHYVDICCIADVSEIITVFIFRVKCLSNDCCRCILQVTCRWEVYRVDIGCTADVSEIIHLQGEVPTQWPLPILIVQVPGRRELHRVLPTFRRSLLYSSSGRRDYPMTAADT